MGKAITVNVIDDTKKIDLKNRIRELRLYLRLKNEDFATKIGVSMKTVEHWQNLKRNELPSPESILNLIEIFRVNPLWLFTGEGGMILGESVNDTISVRDYLESIPKEDREVFADLLEKVKDKKDIRLRVASKYYQMKIEHPEFFVNEDIESVRGGAASSG